MAMPWRRRWLPAVLVLWLPSQLCAYTVEPNMLVLGPGANDSSAFLHLSNRTPKPTALELVINEFQRDEEGRGVMGRAASGDFIIYPSQLVLLPGDEASVQLRWIGTAPEVERAYSITTREVKIPADDAGTGDDPADSDGVTIHVNVLINYDVRVYVRPRGARPRVVVESVEVMPGVESQPDIIEVMLVNVGTAHQSLRELSLLLVPVAEMRQDARPPLKLASPGISGMSASLLPGGRRLLRISRPEGFPAGPVRVQLSD